MYNYVYGTRKPDKIDWSYGTTNGNDIIYAGDGNDTIWAYAGDDFIWAGTGDDTIYAGHGNDYIFGEDGDDVIYAGYGDDWIRGGEGADYISGGWGNDTADYGDSSLGVYVSLATGRGYGGDAEGDILVSIENVVGSSHSDYLVGDWQNNRLSGGAGSDTLHGGAGDDHLFGGTGGDRLYGGAGADVLDGGDGNDTAGYNDSAAGVWVSLMHNIAQGGDAQGDTLISIENLEGSMHADLLMGDNQKNVIHGWDSDDSIYGFGGNDTLYGDNGNDTLIGGAGEDWLYGGAGDDRLFGEEGRDRMWGGAGADTFVWNHVNETGWAGYIADVVADFSFAEGDRLDVSAIDADLTAAGNQAFTFIGDAQFSGVPGELRYYHADGNTYIQMQVDAGPSADAVICLEGIHAPEANWFVL